MNFSTQKRMAADLLKVGVNRVWIDPDAADEVEQAVTRDDVRGLIDEGVIQRRRSKGQSRGRARTRQEKRKKRRGTGHGKRKGRKGARNPSKRQWVSKIRAQRKALRELRDSGAIDRDVYREHYRKAAGGIYPDVFHMKKAIKDAGHLEEEE